ncbi:MAG: helix-turn-helix transcriptional regulator [Caldilineaceae bacterium]
MTTREPQPIGHLLRTWRQRRRLSQLALASEANISTKHLSFVETGRSLPSREMLLDLAECLDVPLRERNILLTAAGYAPVFPERPLDDPALHLARTVIELVLTGYEPYPALALDRHWTLVAANRAVAPLLAGVDPALLTPPVNVLRLSLHPSGLAPRIINLAEWRLHLLSRLRRQIELTADPVLADLLHEIVAYPLTRAEKTNTTATPGDYAGIAVPLRLRTENGNLAFFSTTTVFGTPIDITLAELAIEAFLPANAATREIFLNNNAFI